MENYLDKLQKIYQERDEEYLKREKEFERNKMYLESFEKQIKQSEADNKERESQIALKEKQLNERERTIEEQEKELARSLIALEEGRNELIKARSVLNQNQSSISNDEAFKDQIDALKRQMEELKLNHEKEILDYKKEIKDLKDERLELLRQNLMLQSGQKETTEPGKVSVTEQTIGSHTEQNKPESTSEDLAAGSLKKYLEQYESEFEELEIHHSEDGEQLHGFIGKVNIYFLFSDPSKFILAGRLAEKAVEQINAGYPELEIEEENGIIYVTGYFVNTVSAESLISKVKTLYSYFM